MGLEETWVVLGGGNKGGIVVREGRSLTSPELPRRLATGALVRERELVGERLHFERVTASGPDKGWVSTRVSGKDIVARGGCVPLNKVDFGRPISKLPEAGGIDVWVLAFEPGRHSMQSLTSLGLGLVKGNYRVRIFGPSAMEVLVRSFGIPFTVAGVTPADFAEEAMAASLPAEDAWNLQRWGEESTRRASKALRSALESSRKRPDVLCTCGHGWHIALAIFSKYGVPVFSCSTSSPTKSWDAGFHNFLWGLSGTVAEVFGSSPFSGVSFEAFYGMLLSPRQLIGTSLLELGGFEALGGGDVVRDIAVKVGGNYTGCWHLPPEVELLLPHRELFGGQEAAGQLEAFLRRPPPQQPIVYLGWGPRACGESAGQLAVAALRALKALGLRGILVAGGDGGPDKDALAAALFPLDSEGLCDYAESNVLFLARAAPHGWLFPRCTCIVHHGGRGTTMAALRAMVPMVVTPADDAHWPFGALVEKLGVGVQVQAGLWEFSGEDLAEAIRQAMRPEYAAKAKEVGAGLRLEFGVRNAVSGFHMFVQGELKTGKMKEEWKRLKEQEAKEEAFQRELADEPEDGVLRPPPERLASGFSDTARKPTLRAGTATQQPASSLRPQGAGRVMTICTPLKGHVIHFKRIAQWFQERAPGYEVHMVLLYDEVDLPNGVFKHLAHTGPARSSTLEALNSIFAICAGLETSDSLEASCTKAFEGGDLMGDLNKVFLEAFTSVKPHVLIAEEALADIITEGFLPALCRRHNALMVTVVPMCIKEHRGHSSQRVQRTLERRQRYIEQQATELYWALADQEEANDQAVENSGGEGEELEDLDGEEGVEAAAEEGVDKGEDTGRLEWPAEGEGKGKEKEKEKERTLGRVAGGVEEDAEAVKTEVEAAEAARPEWLPACMTLDELNHIVWKMIPESKWYPPLRLFPSPSFFHAEEPEANEVYCAPFLPLPALGSDGNPQQGRASLEGLLPYDLLDWLFSEESDDPIVYVAFGTIVSTFSSRALVERFVEALSDGPWRVLLVLPESARAGIPQESSSNFWRWTAVGVEFAKTLQLQGVIREGDVFTERQLRHLQRAGLRGRCQHESLASLGIIRESTARAELLQPSRWRVESFVPQVHVLRCERVRCFVSHNGANSTLESMACGVPMLCTPFFMDQYDWASTVRQHLCAGIQVDKLLTDSQALRSAVTELLWAPAYRRNAQAVARRIAAQSQALARVLGPALEPGTSLGPGLSVLGAICMGHVQRFDVWPFLEAALIS